LTHSVAAPGRFFPAASFSRLPLWARVLLSILAVLAIARGLALIRHDPLLAFANNYDQIRYTSCLDLAPWRSSGVDAGLAHPSAPLSRFSFQPLASDACLWTSDLLLTAPVALGWRISEAFGGRSIHSVRRLAEFRLLAWFVVAFWATCVFLRENRADVALAHMAWLALVGMDPANTLYLATFYTEAAAMFGLYVCGVGVAASLLRPTRVALAITIFGAALLAASKLQHVLLPALLGLAVLVGAGRTGRRAAIALLLGGALGSAVQVGNQLRDTWMMHNIGTINRADFLLTVLLEETSDRERIARALDLDEDCLAAAGKNAYEIPAEQTCKTLSEWSGGRLWWLLISDPPAFGRALVRIPALLLPWLPEHLGVVADQEYGQLPETLPSVSYALGHRRGMATALLLLPWLVFLVCAIGRVSPRARGFALLCSAGASSVAVVALLGDGDVEYAKHAHLAVTFALASLCVPLAGLFGRMMPMEIPQPNPGRTL
jgi:hypothetical protein